MKADQSIAQSGLAGVSRFVDHLIKKKQFAIGFVPTLLRGKSVWLLLIAICATNTVSAQAIFSNSITGANPSTSNPYTAGQTTDANITVSGIGRGTGIAGSNGGDRYNANGWNSVSFDANDYFEWTLTPNSVYKINFVNLVYTGQVSGTGPTGFVFRASVDGFTADIGTPTAAGATVSLAGSPYQDIRESITFRLYGFGASSSGGTFSVNDFTFNGTVVSTCTNPTAFNVTGGGSYCSGGTGVAVGLTNSEVGRNYQLFRAGGAIAVGSFVAGTGSAISFGDQTVADTYTVVATNTAGNCTAIMAGDATVTITSPVTPSVTVTANPGTTTCVGNQVIFTAIPVNGGGSPTYVWKTNGVQDSSVTGSSATYTNSSLANGETVDCQMTSSLTCVTTSTADAPQLTVTITTSVTPLVSVSSNPGTTICAGSQVIFAATPVNGGASPNYIWKTNGVKDISVPASSATYTNSSLANAETVDCQLISNDPCASPATADATQIVMTVNPVVTPTVTVLADPGSSICSNSPVTFTATPVNGGASPAYQWRTNGISVTGATSPTFLTSTLKNGDVVTVVMTASADVCASPSFATSSDITMTVNPIPSSVITVAASVLQNSTGNTASVPDAGGGASYVWTISNGTITAGDGTAAITYTAGNAIGTLTLGCTVTTGAGCSSVGSVNVSVQAPVLAGWDVSTQPGGSGNFGVSPLPASSSDGNLAIGGLTRGAGVSTTGTGAARGWGGTDWQSASTAAAVTANKFATFTLAAKPGFKVSYNAVSKFGYRRSSTGPDSGTIQYQVGSGDSFHDITTVSYTSTNSSGGTLSPIDLSGISALQDVPADAVVTFRIVNFGGSSSSGTWYVFDTANNTSADLEVSGYVSCVPPTATLSGDATNCVGDAAILTTTLSGVSPWSVTWSDGVTSNNVTSSPLIRVVSPAATAVYTLTSVTDSGGCGAGAVSGSATVTVNPLPTVTVEPVATNAECGSTIILIANPGGDGPLTYQWYDTQTNAIAGETNVALTLTSIHGAKAGNYTIVVTGPFCTASAVGSVTVADVAAPVITVLGPNPATNECHAAYTDAGATASDACAGGVNVSTNSTVDANVPGVYVVTYAADDGNGNTNTATRTVYVVDTAAPVITYYFTNLTLSANSSCLALMPDVTGTNYILAEDVCGAITITQTPTNNALLNLGTNEVVLAVADGAGHTVYSTNTIVVVDTTPPVITLCPTNRSLTVDNTCFVVLPDFAGELEANDACSGVSLSQSPTAGAELGPGQYVITFTARDGASNASSCVLQLTVLSPPGANTNISISEFLAKNTVGITDDFGAFSDWIEIHNAGNCAVNLAGWALTDAVTALAKWQFPSTNIGAGQFLVVWASDQDRRIPGAPLHTNFKLSDGGEYLGLVQPDGVTIATQFAPAFPPQLTDVAYGLPADRPTNTFLAWPTPGLPNSPATNFIVGGTNVIISEFMAKNTFTLADEDGVYSDWIEIHNVGTSTVDLNNWSLTDNPAQLTKWRFPATNLVAGQFLVVWASDKNRRTPGAPLHTNFKMSDEGEYLALVQPDGVTIATEFAPTFPPQFPDVSSGLPSDGMTNNYLAWATPGLSNSLGTNFIVASLEFSPGRGWFKNGVSVSIATPTPGVTIYWTTDGTVPGPTNGSVYSGPLVFSDTTVLRAAAHHPAYLPTVGTHTYVFPRQVADQTGAGFPPNWGMSYAGLVPTYYAFNSNLVNDPQWRSQMPAALRTLPTLSVVMNPDDMFGTNGIYSNPFGDGDEWERPCSVEYFRPGGETYFGPDAGMGFQINCGIRIQGSSSRDPTYTPKHNLRLLFKQMYGAAPLAFDLYPGSPVQQFNTLVLHASSGDHWFGVGATAQMHRDQWVADTQQETGGFGTHGVYVQLYINGLYWGVYNLGERPDVDYAVSYLGGNKLNYDIFNGEELKDGTTNALNELLAIAQAGITNDIAWSNVNHYLDIPTYIDFLMINWYTINHDFTGHNYWLNGSVSHGVPFHFLTWDAESTFDVFRVVPLDYPIIDLTEAGSGPVCVLYASLRQHPEFRRLFADHVQRLLFNHGALTPERSADRWMKRALEIDTAIVAESLRWGITNWWASNYWGWNWKLNTRDDWIAEQTYLMTNWFPHRTDILIEQLRDAGLYPTLGAPVFSPYGGIIVESLPVTISPPADATLYYTTNGADPRLPDGSVSPDAFVSAQELTVTLTGDTLLRARAFATNTWSALVEATYLRSSQVELRLDGIAGRSDRTVELDIVAWPGAAYSLRASTNLNTVFTNWEIIATIVPFPDGTFTFVDTAATNYPARFYRLTWP